MNEDLKTGLIVGGVSLVLIILIFVACYCIKKKYGNHATFVMGSESVPNLPQPEHNSTPVKTTNIQNQHVNQHSPMQGYQNQPGYMPYAPLDQSANDVSMATGQPQFSPRPQYPQQASYPPQPYQPVFIPPFDPTVEPMMAQPFQQQNQPFPPAPISPGY